MIFPLILTSILEYVQYNNYVGYPSPIPVEFGT